MTRAADVIFLVGPTAAGKTAVAVELARRLGGEIVSADSMQVYRGLDVLSAKPSAAERRRVRHHLIDVSDPGERFDAACFARLAAAAVEGIRRRGRLPVVAGGSGMYVRALADGLFEGPGRDPALRAALEEEARLRGRAALHDRLRAIDPEAAAAVHPNDLRRIVRAIEIHERSGRRPSSLRTRWASARAGAGEGRPWHSERLGCRCIFAGMRRERDDLARRIAERVGRMLREGAVGEVRALLGMRPGDGATVMQSLGVDEIRGFLEGRHSLEEAGRLIERATRAYAKRQMTWFGRDPRIRWFDVPPGEPPAATAARIADSLHGVNPLQL
ncbi:MAG: tRNA (adenosine(37)-N6)-dimethylallyltransferase MiaA [bacterium]|nr:tRNA (adenosine(37)-N6)-dimethylallyltransferase MiaA [bacterium]